MQIAQCGGVGLVSIGTVGSTGQGGRDGVGVSPDVATLPALTPP